MAKTRIIPLHLGKGRTVGRAISAIIDYEANPTKTNGGQLITSFACDSCLADTEFLYAKYRYIRNTGRTRGKDDVIAYPHILDEDRKVNAHKFESAFYANPDLREVRAPQEQQPKLDLENLLLQLQQSPELADTLANLLARRAKIA